MSENTHHVSGRPGFQDTGNPVLDSTVNITAAAWGKWKMSTQTIREIHETLLELAQKEPGGLMRRSSEGRLEPAE